MIYWFIMKKLLTSLIIIMAACPAMAEHNPFMGNNKNQIALNFGQGVEFGYLTPPPWRYVPFYFFHAQYSQPTTFFKIPARQSLNIGQTVGFGEKYHWQWDRFTVPMVFLSEDISLFEYNNFYFAAGAGGGLQAKQNKRLGSKWLFQFKIIAGYRINDTFGIEAFMQHFSNGNTAPENHSYAFYGMGLTYSF